MSARLSVLIDIDFTTIYLTGVGLTDEKGNR
jgi:hypothetical protein